MLFLTSGISLGLGQIMALQVTQGHTLVLNDLSSSCAASLFWSQADIFISSHRRLFCEDKKRIMEKHITREAALELLKKYNKDSFHIHHALTVEGVMRWYAKQLGFAEDEDFWGIVGLLHDIDFEMYPEEHCIKAPELLREGGVGEEMIHAICSHAYGMHVDVKPEHLMEKVLFATDELTGLIGAAALMRPSKSVQDMELKSLKKKYKIKAFAAGCSREVIEQGAEMLGWPLDEVLQKTLDAMKDCEAKQ